MKSFSQKSLKLFGVKFLLWGYIASPHGGPVVKNCSAVGQLHCKTICGQGDWELVLQSLWGSDEHKCILRYMQQLHCDLKVSVISIGYDVIGTKIFLPTFIPGRLSKFQLNITENKNQNNFTHQDNNLLNSIHKSMSIQELQVKKSWHKQIK